MFLTGINNQQDRENRTADYYNNLRKRIKLNTSYEEAVNANVDRTISGITKPPPPEENLDRDLNDLNLQKQKTFENIKTVLKKHDEATRFLGKLDDAEIVPFNRYFSKFKNTTTGIEVKDADFLIKLWDTFKKKILLTDKETPILGTDLDDYKRELQIKADNIVEYAAELGLDFIRIKGVLEKMVNDSDSAAIDKFYYNLLTKGTPAAAVVLKEDFEAEKPRPILTEEVISEEIRSDYEKRLDELDSERNRYITPLHALIERIIPFNKTDYDAKAPKPINRVLNISKDKKIITNNLPIIVEKVKKINREMNDILIKLGSEDRVAPDDILNMYKLDEETKKLLPGLSLTEESRLVEEEPERLFEEEKEIVSVRPEKSLALSKQKIDFDNMNDSDFNSLVEAMNADSKQIYNEILRRHPDGKFEYNGIKYNMNRNPPLLEKQIEYVLKPFYDVYRVSISPANLFEQLKASDRYLELQAEKQLELEEAKYDDDVLKKTDEVWEEIKTDDMNKAEKKKFLEDLQKEAQSIASEVFTQQQLTINKTFKPLISGIRDRMYKIAAESGFGEFKLSDGEITNAFQNDINDTVINLMGLIVAPVEPDLDRIDDISGRQNKLLEQRANLVNNLEFAKGKNASKMRNQLSEMDAEIATNEDFLNRNASLYEKVDILRTKLKPLSEFMYEIKVAQADNIQRVEDKLATMLKPLEDRYDDISNKLYDEGINIPSLNQAVNQLELSNRAPVKKVKKPKNIINVPKQKPVKYELPPKPMNKAQRRVLDEIDNKENLLNYGRRDRYFGGEGLVEQPKKRDRLTKIKFGKYSISGKALGSGILDIRTECNRTSAKLGRTPISSRLEKAINYVIKNNDIDVDMFEALTAEEKKLFLYAIEIAEVKLNSIPFNVFKKFNAADINKELDSLIDRYHLLVGQLGAGNNAPEILRELRGILFKLLEKKKIDKIYANELLFMINSVA